MKYIITPEQIDLINKTLFECNLPVKVYSGLVELLSKLPPVKEDKPEPEEGRAVVNVEAEGAKE